MDFINFNIKDLIDILLVAYLLYQSYRLMKDSGSINIFIGILVFIGCWVLVSQVLGMRLLGSIFDKLVNVGVLALIVLFQDDIRRKYHLKSCDTYFLLHCNSQASIRIKRDRYNPPKIISHLRTTIQLAM